MDRENRNIAVILFVCLLLLLIGLFTSCASKKQIEKTKIEEQIDYKQKEKEKESEKKDSLSFVLDTSKTISNSVVLTEIIHETDSTKTTIKRTEIRGTEAQNYITHNTIKRDSTSKETDKNNRYKVEEEIDLQMLNQTSQSGNITLALILLFFIFFIVIVIRKILN